MKTKKQKLDERTLRAIDDIKFGDKVKFFDCVEATVYKDTEFRVSSEYPEIEQTKYGVMVFVTLRGLGRFHISKLVRVEEEMRFSDLDVEKGARCCCEDIPRCDICPYNKSKTPKSDNPIDLFCKSVLDRDILELLKRKDKYKAQREAKAKC